MKSYISKSISLELINDIQAGNIPNAPSDFKSNPKLIQLVMRKLNEDSNYSIKDIHRILNLNTSKSTPKDTLSSVNTNKRIIEDMSSEPNDAHADELVNTTNNTSAHSNNSSTNSSTSTINKLEKVHRKWDQLLRCAANTTLVPDVTIVNNSNVNANSYNNTDNRSRKDNELNIAHIRTSQPLPQRQICLPK